MFEEAVNQIVDQTNDQLDILKVYIEYRVTFHVERTLNRLRVLQSVGWFPGTFEFTDSAPVSFDMLKKAYDDGLSKAGAIQAIQMSTDTLNKDIETLMNEGS
jgi:hypothetical protein